MMRYVSLIIVLFIFVTACSEDGKEMELTGTVKGLKKGTIFLQKYGDTSMVSVDSVLIDGDPNFVFNRTIKSPEVYYLYLKLKDGTLRDDRIAFFAEDTVITISTSLKDFGTLPLISGSNNHDKLEEYKLLIQRFNDKNLELIQAGIRAEQENNDSLRRAIENRQHSIIRSKYLATVNFALNHKHMEIAPYLMLSEAYDAQVKYLDMVYKALTPEIKNSKYGITLDAYIQDILEEDQ